MKGQDVLFSKKVTNWLTPIPLFLDLKEAFDLEYDPCADDDNPLPILIHTTHEYDGLTKTWDYNTFINPPYDNIGAWVDKAVVESQANPDCYYVLLLPSRTDREWFRTILDKYTILCFVSKRLKFSNSKNNAPFPSIIAVLGRSNRAITRKQRETFEKYGAII